MSEQNLTQRAHRHGKNSELIEQQAARIAELERVLRLFSNDGPGAIYRRFDATYARQYCALCGSEWAVGESERHSAYCPLPAARALLGDA